MFRRYAVAVLMCALPLGAQAQQPTAEAFLAAIYTPYLSKDYMGDDYIGRAERFFVPDLAEAMKRDSEQNPGMVGAIDFDPFIEAQAFEMTNLSIAATTDGVKATGHVTFTNLGKPMHVVIDLVQTSAGWRIADIKWPDRPLASLRALYKLH
ncbi:MAG: hypothetical protein ACHQK9_01815 [Reyranellales bacterium]